MAQQKDTVAIYVRSNHDLHVASEWRRISNQIEQCLVSAKSHGFGEDAIYLYKDECVSGIAKSPPALEGLLNVIGAFKSIYVANLDRLSRNSDRVASIIDLIRAAGVTLWTCDPVKQVIAIETNLAYPVCCKSCDRVSPLAAIERIVRGYRDRRRSS